MEPLPTTRRMMVWLCMCPANESATHRQNVGYIAHTLVVLIICLISITTGLAYCLKFISIDFDGAIFGFMAAIAEFGIIYELIVALGMRYHIANIFTSLSTIYKTSKFKLWIFAQKNFNDLNSQMKMRCHFDTWLKPIISANVFGHFT